MFSKKNNKLRIFQYFLCSLCVVNDASMPECKNAFDKCQCHRSYKLYNKEMDDDQKTTKLCLKLHKSKKLNWKDADKKCKTEFSYLLFNYTENTAFEDYKKEGINLIWIGIQKLSGYYTSLSNYPSLFKESNEVWGRQWAGGEPIYDCVALDISTGNLVTRSCSTRLEFVCQNNGFPVYPIANTLACPEGWLFYYHIDMDMKKCIRVFKRRDYRQDTEEECKKIGATAAEVDGYIELYAHMSKSNIKDFASLSGSICNGRYIESVLGGPRNVMDTAITCPEMPFICEQDFRSISLVPKILPDVIDSIFSTDTNSTTFACNVTFNGKNVPEIEQLHFKWFKNGIPSSDGNFLHLSPSSMIHQGSYHCEVRVEGLQGAFLSSEVPYVYADVSTYILTLHGNARELRYEDFSKISFQNFRSYLNDSMTVFSTGDLLPVANLNWNLQKTWSDGNSATVQILLYLKRNESLDMILQEEVEFYNTLQRYTIRKQTDGRFVRISLKLQSAVICFEESVPSSETSYDEILLWKDATQTKSAISEPMCLNDWRLVTRECKPNFIDGAKWLPFDYSMCTKYQQAVQDKKYFCPPGLKVLESNICYNVFTEKHTFEDAEGICRNRLSFLMNLKLLNSTRLLSELEISSKYWYSERTSTVKSKNEIYSYHKMLNPSFHCIIVNQINGTLVYKKSICKVDEKHAFVCIHQPLIMLESRLFSKPWNKFPLQSGCFYIESSKKTWEEAKESCQVSLGKSNLLQSIQNMDDYSTFKALLYNLPHLTKGMSWWISLFQDKDSLKWLNSPEETVTFVDWEAHTNFKMNQSGGILTVGSSRETSIHWSLRDLSSKESFICEMRDCTDPSPVSVDIDDKTVFPNGNDSDLIPKLNYQCITNGWFVANSISWFKDDDILRNSERIAVDLSLHIETGPTVDDSLKFQGYYWCSVDQELYITQIFSPKVLFKHPGWHTFVLYVMKEVPEFSNCSDLISQDIQFFLEFNENSRELLSSDNFFLYLKDASCIGSELHYYDHIYVSKRMGNEERVNEIIETSITSQKSILMEELLKKLKVVNNERFSLRSTVVCPSEKSHHGGYSLTWPETPVGQSAFPEEACTTEDGNALERMCMGSFNTGGFWSPLEKVCTGFESALTVSLRKLAKANITKGNVLNSSLSMEDITTHHENFSTTDVNYVARILQNIANVPDIQLEIVRSVVTTVDTVIDVEIPITDIGSLSDDSSKISSALEDILSNVQTNGQVIVEARNNIAVSAVPLNTNFSLIPAGGVLEHWGSNVTTLFNDSNKNPSAQLSQFENFEAAVLLPDNLLAEKQNIDVINIPIIIRRNFHFLRDVEKDVKVISPVIDVSIGRKPVHNVNPPIEMVFNVSEVILNGSKSFKCVFWAADRKVWSDEGCYSELINLTRVHCFCDHLTSFAIIVDLKVGAKTNKFHLEILSIITYAGSCLSIFGLGMIILTFIVFRKWRAELKHKVLINLSLALVLFLFVFLIGVEKKHWGYGCMAISILLHYSVLATFAWMLVEAYLQYLRLVKVIGTYIPRFLQKAMLFAWGVPLVVVGIVAGFDYNLYNDDSHEYCWLTGKVFYFAVAGPSLSMLATNFVIFALILHSNTCGKSKKFLRTNQDERKELLARAKAVFCVSVLLGLSWLFGFLAVGETKLRGRDCDEEE
ncbi:Adhesion G-protein coupled receptor G6 like protein [Argiope bruennichi]|uniref:Adhesion G-protein coupled receptor G6 like protein n=3 Tax=Argiope bruennichi TaxID=94029 RepID=A0A8T0DYX1_ARGBR|nr:Adhesion G-protein coupled receptor G6 like protein [Argiope bruennichi]